MTEVIELIIEMGLIIIGFVVWYEHIIKMIKQSGKDVDKVVVTFMYFIITLVVIPLIIFGSRIIVKLVEEIIK